MRPIIDIISQMQKPAGVFAKGEQQVADFILGDLENTAFLNQNEIATAAQVSVATVNRFCITLGCIGFRDFKIRLAQSVAVSLQYLNSKPKDNLTPHLAVDQVFNGLEAALGMARQQLQAAEIDQAIATLGAARRIIFFGVGGGSANVAREGANRFFRLGIPSEAHSDGYFQRMLASTLGTGDVVFAISASGQPRELLDSVAIAKQYGATSISLTARGSPLALLSDISLTLDLPEDRDIFKPSASRLVFMAVIDVLATGAARQNPALTMENLRRIRTSLVALSQDTGPQPIGD